MKKVFKAIVESGLGRIQHPAERRMVTFSNYLALTLIAADLLIFLIIPFNHTVAGLRNMAVAFALFALPVYLNHKGLHIFAKLYLCWCPPVLIVFAMISGMSRSPSVPITTYDGMRFYLLATSCIPFLLLSPRRLPVFIVGVAPSLALLIFGDHLLDFTGVGVAEKGAATAGYAFNSFRSIVSYAVVTGSCFALKLVVEQGDARHEALLRDLEAQNKIIQQQASEEVNQLNQQLLMSLQQMTEREFILNQSQRIAKIGSWEYRIENSFMFWSDEMYNIFSVDKELDLSEPTLIGSMFGSQGEVLSNSVVETLRSGKEFNHTLRAKTPIGYHKWVRILGTPIYEQGTIIGVRGICHDITSYKEAEEMLRKSEFNYRSLFEQASDAIVIFDFNGTIIDVNAGFCKLFSYSKSELLKLNLSTLMDAEELTNHPIDFDTLARGEHVFSNRRMVTRNHHIIEVEANTKMLSHDRIMSIARNITERIAIEQEKETALRLLNKRIKELTALYRTSQLLNEESRPISEVLFDVVAVLPRAWQYSEICAARILVADSEFVTPMYEQSKYRQVATFLTGPASEGIIEVVYQEAKLFNTEKPFMEEEQHLLNMIAEMLQVYFIRIHEREALSRAQANLRATINNTELFIWSVDRNFNLITFNLPFFNLIKENFGAELKAGESFLEFIHDKTDIDTKNTWRQRYLSALAGQITIVEEKYLGLDFHYSLSPIIENSQVIGVSAFAENVTERKAQDRALAEANKTISELKLMALRSVMSPHFIFNVLNSIQFFIAKNDRLNAINYLSTFSKLIRSVLSNSVNNTIKLKDEVELLTNYIQLEMTRFENKFNYSLVIDPDVDVDGTEIPSLLIQPYVENAILHGLYNKTDGLGNLIIRFHDDVDSIVVEIEDDGIGREAAIKLKQQNFPTHKSMGVKLTEERLRLINQHKNTSVVIDDLTNDAGGCGTRVTVRISY